MRLRDRLTDIEDIQNNLEMVQKYPGNVSINFRNISHPELEMYFFDKISVRKKANQQTDRHKRNSELF